MPSFQDGKPVWRTGAKDLRELEENISSLVKSLALDPQHTWDDQLGDVVAGIGAANIVFEAIIENKPLKTWCMRHDQDDELHFRFQLGHKWDGGPVRPHVHFIPSAATTPTATKYVNWIGELDFMLPHRQQLRLAAQHQFDVTLPVLPEHNFVHVIHALGEFVPPDEAAASSFVLIRLVRSGTGANDTYTDSKGHATNQANVCLLGVDIHRRENRSGTYFEF